jgi:hypothetical protein
MKVVVLWQQIAVQWGVVCREASSQFKLTRKASVTKTLQISEELVTTTTSTCGTTEQDSGFKMSGPRVVLGV